MRYKLLQAGLSGKCISIIKAVYRNVKKRGKSPEILQYLMDKLCTYYKKWNIVVNTNKTKVVVFRNGRQIAIVNSYVYIGIIFHYNGTLYLCYNNVFHFRSSTEASTHAYNSAGAIVEEKMRDHIVPGDFNLPKPDNLIRAVNRPAEPTELNLRYLYCQSL
jgi:hypothetical protein